MIHELTWDEEEPSDSSFRALNFCLNSLYFLSLLGGKKVSGLFIVFQVFLANSKILPIFLRPSLKGLETRDST